MSEMKWAIITGADGGMGTEITRAVAKAGYRIIMACYHPKKTEVVRERLSKETGNPDLEVMALDLSSMQSVISFVSRISERNLPIALLMNNAGTMETGFHTTSEGFERTVSVNYIGPYLLTRKLIPLMVRGARIVNMVSCTYAIGKLDFPDFFHRGKTGTFWRISVYSNTKLALLLFTFELSEQLREKGITVNAADPGIVSTDIITMHKWFDRSFNTKMKQVSSIWNLTNRKTASARASTCLKPISEICKSANVRRQIHPSLSDTLPPAINTVIRRETVCLSPPMCSEKNSVFLL